MENKLGCLIFLGISQTTNSGTKDGSRVGGKNVSSAGDGLLACLAAPNANTGSLHGFLRKGKNWILVF